MNRRDLFPGRAFRARLAAMADASWPALVAELRARAEQRRALAAIRARADRADQPSAADDLQPPPPPPGVRRP